MIVFADERLEILGRLLAVVCSFQEQLVAILLHATHGRRQTERVRRTRKHRAQRKGPVRSRSANRERSKQRGERKVAREGKLGRTQDEE